MKKNLFKVIWVLAACCSFTACDTDDEPAYEYQEYSNGAYVVNAGNTASLISGSLTHIDFTTFAATQKAFLKANGKNLGRTANDGIVYGNKVYVVVDGENTIEVLDKKSMIEIAQINTTKMLGDEEGAHPRHIIGSNGAVYFTTYGGYVAAVDTTKFALAGKWQVGSYPEGLAGINNFIYVANSDYGRGNGTLSVINLTSNEVVTKAVEGVENPQKIFFVNNELWVLDWGHYLSVAPWTQEKSGLKKVVNGKVNQTVPATLADLAGSKFYIINSPYGTTTTTYSYYDAKANTSGTFDFAVEHPTAIAVDPIKGNIFISSHSDAAGYASYNVDGYLMVFDAKGKELHKLDVGVGSCAIFFDAGVNVIRR